MDARRIVPSDLFDLSHTNAAQIFENITYVWEVLPKIKGFIPLLASTLPDDFEMVKENVWIGKGTTIEDAVLIKGPAIIGYDCEIRHGAYIRENVILGNGVVVGNSSEVKNAILFDKVQIPHFNYVGDSILGFKSHLGAGVILSNFKSDGGNIKVRNADGSYAETGLRKFGAMIGDYAEIGCNSVLNPGTIVGRNSTVYPLSFVRGVIPSGCILKRDGVLVEKR